jgi:lipoprotein-anchoring transpeptidase ErfK/SrfK
MSDQQPVEPDAIIGRDGAAVPGPRGSGVVPQPLPSLVPALARVAFAGPLLTASAIALTAAAAAKAVELAGRVARQHVGAGAVQQVFPGSFEVTWTRVEVRWTP